MPRSTIINTSCQALETLVTGYTEPANGDAAGPSDVDLDFLSRFENCQLPESEWTQLAHIRVAWICHSIDSPDRALARIRAGILRYNTNVLKRRKKYHETVTVAFAGIVAARMKTGESWKEFAARIDDILNARNPVLLKYYSEQQLFSDKAGREFVEPDKAELPEFDS